MSTEQPRRANQTTPLIDQSRERTTQHMPPKLRSSRARHIKNMFPQLNGALVKCELSREKFLPSDVLDAKITKETVKAALPLARILQPKLAEKITRDAKKIFAILVFIGEAKSISDLYSDGLRDEHLPLQRSPNGQDEKILKSADNNKEFKAFAKWDSEAKTNLFLEWQWVVQVATVGDIDQDVQLDPRRPLPFQASTVACHNSDCVVHQAEIHPAYTQGFEARYSKAP